MAQLSSWRPATLADAATLLPRLPLRLWNAVTQQVTGYPALTLARHDGVPLLMVCLVPVDGAIEACVIFPWRQRPPATALRRLLRSAAGIVPDRPMIARISDRNAASHRMARAVGFRPTDELLRDTDVRTWRREALAGQGLAGAET